MTTISSSIHPPASSGWIFKALTELAEVAMLSADTIAPEIDLAAKIVVECLEGGGKILACGNGGSAADAQHFVAELVGRMSIERRSLPAISLSSDPSIMTALGNDYGFDRAFARQIEGLGNRDDVLVGISTSGTSRNVLEAMRIARSKGMKTVLLSSDRRLDPIDCDIAIRVPSKNTQRIQEIHAAVLHCICESVDRCFSNTAK